MQWYIFVCASFMDGEFAERGENRGSASAIALFTPALELNREPISPPIWNANALLSYLLLGEKLFTFLWCACIPEINSPVTAFLISMRSVNSKQRRSLTNELLLLLHMYSEVQRGKITCYSISKAAFALAIPFLRFYCAQKAAQKQLCKEFPATAGN